MKKEIASLFFAGMLCVTSSFVSAALPSNVELISGNEYGRYQVVDGGGFSRTGSCRNTYSFDASSSWDKSGGEVQVSARTYIYVAEYDEPQKAEYGITTPVVGSCSIDENHGEFFGVVNSYYQIAQVEFAHLAESTRIGNYMRIEP